MSSIATFLNKLMKRKHSSFRIDPKLVPRIKDEAPIRRFQILGKGQVRYTIWGRWLSFRESKGRGSRGLLQQSTPMQQLDFGRLDKM